MTRPPPFMHPLAALWLLCPAALLAQTSGPPTDMEAFKALRSSFQIQALAQSQKLTEQYERALARQETELAEAGDYEQALEIQKRRSQLQALYAGGSSALSELPALPLEAAQAKLLGVAAQADSTLVGWRSSSHYAEWSSVKLHPGDYYLEFDYLMLEAPQVGASGTLTAEPRATLEFFEVSLLAGEENRRSFDLQMARNSTASTTPMRVGPIRYTRSPVTLRLGTTRSYPGNIIRLQNLRLIPVPIPSMTAAKADATSATPPLVSISDLRATLASELTAAYQPLIENQITRLNDLASHRPEWKPHLNSELRALQRRLASTENTPKNGKSESLPLPRPIATLGGISGFNDLESVTYLPHAENTGDRFHVRHQDQDLVIRLLWLRCAPPLDPDKPGGPSVFSRHFDIPPDDAALFGRAAREFTSGYLEGKTFRVLARSNADADGTVPALIFLDDIGLYHPVLIDQGLAAVVGKADGGGTLERAFLRSLFEREAEARQRDPRPGAWAMSPLPPKP